MHPFSESAAPFAAICGSCRLSSICFDRAIFKVTPDDRENRPIPSLIEPAEVLQKLGRPLDSLPVCPPPTPKEALAIRVHRALIDGSPEWTPVRDFVFDVACGERVVRTWVGPPRSDLADAITVANGLVAACEHLDEHPPSAVIKYVLERLGDAPEDSLASLAGRVAEDLEKDATGLSTSLLGVVQSQFLLETTDGQILSCRLRSTELGGNPAFLCGHAVLEVDPGLLEPLHPALGPVATTVSRMSMGLSGSNDETSTWFRHLWDQLGALLLPRSGARGAITGGTVAADCISLKVRSGSDESSLVFRRKDTATTRSYAVVGNTSISHERGQLSGDLSRVMAAYVSRLRR